MRLLDHIFLLRPTVLGPVWVFLLLGYYRAGGEMIFIPSSSFLLIFLIYTMIMGAVYILNQITDIETDRINEKLFILPRKLVSVRSAYIQATLLIVLALLLSFRFPVTLIVFLSASFLLGLLYSVRPFKLKGRPFLDLLSNAFGYGFLAFSTGFISAEVFSLRTFFYSIPYIFAVGGVFVNTTIPDIKGDRESGEITTGVLLGARKATLLALFLMCSSFISSIIVGDIICLICAGVSLPLFLWAYSVDDGKRERTALISVRISAPILAIAVSIIYPWFLLLLLSVFFVSRFYYKRRFNIVYPSIW